jgi:RNA polymerase sigma factor (sigma-70 family)
VDVNRADDADAGARAALERGDRSGAIDLLAALHGKAIYRYCYRLVLDMTLAEDILQTTFLQAFRDLDTFDDRSSFRTWLFGIARHRCLDALKKRRRWQRRFEPLKDAPEPEDDSLRGEENALSRERREALKACLQQLEAHVRDAVLLRYMHDFSYPQMAALSHERPPALQARVARAMPALRRCMENKGVRL